MNKVIGILGGTFDPIHNGHLNMATQAELELNLDEIRFMPCHVPVHKAEPHANKQQRLDMLKLAVDKPNWKIDTRELDRDTASYMVTSLQELRQDEPNATLCLLVGMDSFNQLTTWYRWQKMLELAHIIIMPRPGHPLTQTHMELVGRLNQSPAAYRVAQAGLIYQLQTSQLLLDNSTEIRKACQRINTLYSAKPHLPQQVFNYIKQNRLYS